MVPQSTLYHLRTREERQPGRKNRTATEGRFFFFRTNALCLSVGRLLVARCYPGNQDNIAYRPQKIIKVICKCAIVCHIRGPRDVVCHRSSLSIHIASNLRHAVIFAPATRILFFQTNAPSVRCSGGDQDNSLYIPQNSIQVVCNCLAICMGGV